MLQKREGAAPLEFNILYVSLGKESVMGKVGVQRLPELPVHVYMYFKVLHIILTSCNNTPQKLLTIHKLSASQ